MMFYFNLHNHSGSPTSALATCRTKRASPSRSRSSRVSSTSSRSSSPRSRSSSPPSRSTGPPPAEADLPTAQRPNRPIWRSPPPPTRHPLPPSTTMLSPRPSKPRLSDGGRFCNLSQQCKIAGISRTHLQKSCIRNEISKLCSCSLCSLTAAQLRNAILNDFVGLVRYSKRSDVLSYACDPLHQLHHRVYNI